MAPASAAAPRGSRVQRGQVEHRTHLDLGDLGVGDARGDLHRPIGRVDLDQGSATVVSADGTRIAFDRSGTGPALVLVEPAGSYRANSTVAGLISPLAEHFTVYAYDRRGRGQSGDTAPYAVEREIEDLAAIIAHAGGHAHLYGHSSGALLAVHAAAAGVGVDRLVLLEPPLQQVDSTVPDPLTGELAGLIAGGRNEDAVEHFLRSCEVPDEIVADLRGTDAWAKLVAVAPTLDYDCRISDAINPAVLARVRNPVLVLDSSASTDNLTGWAATAAARLPHAKHRTLSGEWHRVADTVLTPVITEFLPRDSIDQG